MEPVKTQVTFTKISCYFCSEWLDKDSFKDHIIHCGQVLTPCPNNCSSYVQRKQLKSHLKDCPKLTKITETNGEKTSQIITELEKTIAYLEQDIGNLRSALNEEIRQRLHLITDVGGLKRKNQISDEWTDKVSEVLNALKKCLNEETESRCIDVERCKEDINRLIFEFQKLEEWKIEIHLRADAVESALIDRDSLLKNIDLLLNDNRVHVAKIRHLEKQLEDFRFQMSEEREDRRSTDKILSDRISIIDDALIDHHSIINSNTNEFKNQIESLKGELFNQNILCTDLVSKQTKLDFVIKNMQHIINEAEDNCDKLEKNVIANSNLSHQTNQNLTDLQEHLRVQNQFSEITNTRGHLIWRIGDYSNKLKEAKEHEVTLRSPMFCNKQYGYTLRLDVSLNGIGTWKGRNLIAGITVVNGEYDSLLPWPCKIEADIILRDQPDDLKDANNFGKVIVAKKKSDKIDHNQYIHIPHKTLESSHFIRDDAIFIEVRVRRS